VEQAGSLTERDIRSTPDILAQTVARIAERRRALTPLLAGPLVFLGCGSSYCIGLAGAALYEAQRRVPAQAVLPSDYQPRPGWLHVAISRTGQTTELVTALRRAKQAGARVLLLEGTPGSPAATYADVRLSLEFAPEQGIIQTRFVSAALFALRLLLGDAVAQTALIALPQRLAQGLITFDPASITPTARLVFLGRGWRYGLARAAAVHLQETALAVPEAHQTLDYRHGPLAAADEGTLVWCFDPPEEAASGAVLEEVQRTGARVRCTPDDPLIALAQAQLMAVGVARAHGVDPDAPRHLSRAIVLPAGEE
jgi:glucosamine--fructose-6-phosphate aminotransferase (isomerizing)